LELEGLVDGHELSGELRDTWDLSQLDSKVTTSGLLLSVLDLDDGYQVAEVLVLLLWGWHLAFSEPWSEGLWNQ
jgi:hypothetical protein